MKRHNFRLVLAAVGLAVASGGAVAASAPSAVRPPAVTTKAQRPAALPPSFAAGVWDMEAQVVLPPLDAAAIEAEDAARVVSGEKALRIGVVRRLARQAVLGEEQGSWSVLQDGTQLWRLTLRVEQARGVRVHLSGVALPEGGELWVFDAEDPGQVRGPYTAATLAGRHAFWAGALFTETVTVECVVPRGADRASAALTIDRVADIYRDPSFIVKEGSCHNDVTCYPAWGAAANGVAGIGSFYMEDYLFCTGCLLNDLDESTWVDYFLTGTHCVVNQSEASEAEFYWFFQTATCNGAPPAVSAVTVTEGGADYLAGRTHLNGNDFALLRLRTPSPDGATFVGWTTDAPAGSEQLACIHHPDGAYKRISFGQLDGSTANYWYVDFTDGATEPGSSGAPLFNAAGQIIGQLYGGSSSCETGGGIDVYGRFDVTYPVISDWLSGEGGTPVPAADPPFGTYYGLLSRDLPFADDGAKPDVCGTFTLSASQRGRITAKALLRQRTLSFKSSGWEGWTDDNDFYAVMQAKGGEVLELYANWITAYGRISGGSLGGEEIWIDAAYHVFGDRRDAAAQADLARLRGYYTIALPAWDARTRGAANELPGGSGYLTMTVGSGGSVKLAGLLADGTKVSQSAKLLLFGDYGTLACVPFFRPLYGKKGAVGGLIWIYPDTRAVDTDWYQEWFVRWDKPSDGMDGFEALLAPCGGYYDKIAPLASHYLLSAETNAVPYYVSGLGVLPQPAAQPQWLDVLVSGARLSLPKGVKPMLAGGVYDYSGVNSALAKLSFSSRTGIYKGSFNLYYDYPSGSRLMHKTVKASYAGILTQTRDPLFAGWPEGQGAYRVTDRNPLFNRRIQRAFWLDLYAAP